MPLDPSILLQGHGITSPDPMAMAQQGLTLSQLADSGMLRHLALQRAQQDQSAQASLKSALPEFLSLGGDANAARTVAMKYPEAGPTILDMFEKRAKATADIGKTTAEGLKASTEAKAKAMNDIGNAAYSFAQNPSERSLPMLQSMAKFYGMELPQYLGDPRDPAALQGYFKSLSDTAYAVKDRIVNAETARSNSINEQQRGGNYASEAERRKAETSQGWATNERMKEQNQNTRAAADENRVNTQTEHLAKLVESQSLPNLSASMRNLNAKLEKYAAPGKEIPGVGAVKGFVPGMFLTADGKEMRAAAQGVANDLLKLYSGGAVTLNEAQRRQIEMMAGGGFNADDLFTAWPMIVDRYNSAAKNIGAGFAPKVVETFKARGGDVLDPIKATTRKNTGGGKIGDGWSIQRVD